jgi:hypothetical protein
MKRGAMPSPQMAANFTFSGGAFELSWTDANFIGHPAFRRVASRKLFRDDAAID